MVIGLDHLITAAGCSSSSIFCILSRFGTDVRSCDASREKCGPQNLTRLRNSSLGTIQTNASAISPAKMLRIRPRINSNSGCSAALAHWVALRPSVARWSRPIITEGNTIYSYTNASNQSRTRYQALRSTRCICYSQKYNWNRHWPRPSGYDYIYFSGRTKTGQGKGWVKSTKSNFYIALQWVGAAQNTIMGYLARCNVFIPTLHKLPLFQDLKGNITKSFYSYVRRRDPHQYQRAR